MRIKPKSDISSSLSRKQNIASSSASSKPASRIGASIICPDAEIKGSIKTTGAMQIDGQVEGDVISADLTVGSTGQVIGEIKAETLCAKGKIVGSIRARKVELETGASIEGDIFHAALIIRPGASFEGRVMRKKSARKIDTEG